MNIQLDLSIEPEVVFPILKRTKDASGKTLVLDSAITIFVLPAPNVPGNVVMAFIVGERHYHPCKNSEELIALLTE